MCLPNQYTNYEEKIWQKCMCIATLHLYMICDINKDVKEIIMKKRDKKIKNNSLNRYYFHLIYWLQIYILFLLIFINKKNKKYKQLLMG
jgi:hypothetical protein